LQLGRHKPGFTPVKKRIKKYRKGKKKKCGLRTELSHKANLAGLGSKQTKPVVQKKKKRNIQIQKGLLASSQPQVQGYGNSPGKGVGTTVAAIRASRSKKNNCFSERAFKRRERALAVVQKKADLPAKDSNQLNQEGNRKAKQGGEKGQ